MINERKSQQQRLGQGYGLPKTMGETWEIQGPQIKDYQSL
jgi:hypothetical protein